MRRILTLDGGGIKGLFSASFLATIEEQIGSPVANFFDLIVGTSTGGIIALGLGLGLTASEIAAFYDTEGPKIFAGGRTIRGLHQIFGRSKYDVACLKEAVERVFGNKKLGQSKKRLVIPSFEFEAGRVRVWKTPHHPRLEIDYKTPVVEVALSTAAAPTFFPVYDSAAGGPLLDGGIWANNPIVVGVVEALTVLNWKPHEVRVLSVGCTETPMHIGWYQSPWFGGFRWLMKIADVFLTAQSTSALGIAQHLLGSKDAVTRVSPVIGERFRLDDVSARPRLRGLGRSEARLLLPHLRASFFYEPGADEFFPCHHE